MKAVFEQIATAYKIMAAKARYRPAAPSDGLGNITVPGNELDLSREALQYADDWWGSEDGLDSRIGCCNFETRPATIFAIEAARQMCSGNGGNATALKLLKLAVKELENVS